MWDRLRQTEKPVVLYGTGNAAEKIMKELDIRDIWVSGIFASDGFVRDRDFHGFKVLSYEAAKARFGDMTVLLCFGSHRPDVIESIVRIAGEQEFYAPDLPVAGDGLFDHGYYEAHREELDWVRERLADDQSRLVFDKVIEYKLSGRIGPLLECQTPEEENWKIAVTSGMSFMDLGAYTGDTVELFSKLCGGEFLKITAVEPEARNLRKLQETAAALFGKEAEHSEKIRLVNAVVGDSCGEIGFAHGAGRGGAAEKGKVRPVRLMTVDRILGNERIDLIKMDLEGAEAAAIRGAEATISSYDPGIIVAAYHRIEDLFAIPQQVLRLNPHYSVYLRKDPCLPAWGVNYYFV